ncbi:MAG TPA: RsmG family class I SAM-dependent methyltransferase [Acidimicrobiales bacterium]|nr:RsmG family class I SAM-dependent methyltransferase [Acidimicrobiales bacterium]
MVDRELLAVLEESRRLGFLGPGPVEAHVAHAAAFLPLLPAEGRLVDLGSGGGLPGLVLARARPALEVVLLDAHQRRTAFLVDALDRLDLATRAVVVADRAEVVGRSVDHRGAAACVVARSFGPPPVTAECAAPLLALGGRLIVSEPPASEVGDRWPPDGLAEVGMTVAQVVDGPPRLVVLTQEQPCPDRFPRRTGIPAKRPLWTTAAASSG